jgi:hypothetical protein
MPRLRSLLTLALLSSFGAAACASAPAPAPVTSPGESAQDFPTATAFVRHLASLAAAGDDAGLEAAIDTSFAERLPSGPELRTLLGAVASGCEPQLSEGPGYSAIAIPPPMVDDSDEEAARIEALIDELSASTEVDASCTVTADEGDEETLMLYTVAVRRGATGWRALAWRDHRHRLD